MALITVTKECVLVSVVLEFGGHRITLLLSLHQGVAGKRAGELALRLEHDKDILSDKINKIC